MSKVNKEDVDILEVREFLDDLRESGQINMFGAAPYLRDAFDISKSEAREFVTQYMKKGLRDNDTTRN